MTADEIKEARKQAGLLQREVAEQMTEYIRTLLPNWKGHILAHHISRWENGEAPPLAINEAALKAVLHIKEGDKQ